MRRQGVNNNIGKFKKSHDCKIVLYIVEKNYGCLPIPSWFIQWANYQYQKALYIFFEKIIFWGITGSLEVFTFVKYKVSAKWPWTMDLQTKASPGIVVSEESGNTANLFIAFWSTCSLKLCNCDHSTGVNGSMRKENVFAEANTWVQYFHWWKSVPHSKQVRFSSGPYS